MSGNVYEPMRRCRKAKIRLKNAYLTIVKQALGEGQSISAEEHKS
jgi:hypothetical protein